MTGFKSVLSVGQDAGWLLTVLLICAVTVAVSSLLALKTVGHFRQVASRKA